MICPECHEPMAPNDSYCSACHRLWWLTDPAGPAGMTWGMVLRHWAADLGEDLRECRDIRFRRMLEAKG